MNHFYVKMTTWDGSILNHNDHWRWILLASRWSLEINDSWVMATTRYGLFFLKGLNSSNKLVDSTSSHFWKTTLMDKLHTKTTKLDEPNLQSQSLLLWLGRNSPRFTHFVASRENYAHLNQLRSAPGLVLLGQAVIKLWQFISVGKSVSEEKGPELLPDRLVSSHLTPAGQWFKLSPWRKREGKSGSGRDKS